MIFTVKNISSLEILDSRGRPTVEAALELSTGVKVRASVPSGASVGVAEALELRDKDSSRYQGMGVLKAVEIINNKLAKELIGKSFLSQLEFDNYLLELDNSENKSNLGANTILALSLCFAKARSEFLKQPLYKTFSDDLKSQAEYLGHRWNAKPKSFPIPLVNVLNGGAHANNKVDIQEFMIVPVGAKTFEEAMHMSCNVYNSLKIVISKRGLSTAVGDEGGFAPNLASNQEALDLLIKAIEFAGYKAGEDICLALDIAASELYKDGKYNLSSEQRSFTDDEFISYIELLCNEYPIISIEDPFAELDLIAWEKFTNKFSNKVQIVGDDLYVTNFNLLQKGIKNSLSNAILIKPNQVGTLSETLATISLAIEHDIAYIISHRSGETEDTSIVDLAIACFGGMIKCGAPARTDRVAKYNQLLRYSNEEQGMFYAKTSTFKSYLKKLALT